MVQRGYRRQGQDCRTVQPFLNVVALVAGLLLFGIVAVAAATLAHSVAWGGTAWKDPQWARLLLFAAIVGVLAVLSGYADGFINLSSLHALYSARLTRAYLGASNNERLKAAADRGSKITKSHRGDYIQPLIYCRADLPAPIHLINATINETIDPQSQLVSRDRKGDILTLEPLGIRIAIEPDPVGWAELGKTECAEQLSLGQWCSISGAAASSGMGRLTHLGLALAFTFANVRLGYWWWSPGACTAKSAAGPVMRLLSKPFGTFVYLFNEMTARYSRAYDRKYITDGGHFENSGAYRLIERRVPLILVTDNGADPKYRFEDLENLVRKVRLDLGGETTILGGDDLDAFLAQLDAQIPPVRRSGEVDRLARRVHEAELARLRARPARGFCRRDRRSPLDEAPRAARNARGPNGLHGSQSTLSPAADGRPIFR